MRELDTPDSPEPGWAEALDPDSVDYLYAESRARLLEQIGGIDAVSGKAKAVAGFAALVILATGILGDLQISFGEDLVGSCFSVIAIAAFVVTVALAGIILWPRPVHTGVIPAWLGEYARDGADAFLLKAAAVEIQVNAFRENQPKDVRNGRLLTATMTCAAIEVCAMVALFVARAVIGSGAMP